MIALVLFLVASMMAVVILNVAVTGIKRVHDDGVRQKDSLNVSSAAKLVAECIKGSTVTDIEQDIQFIGMDDTIEIWAPQNLELTLKTEEDFGREFEQIMNTENAL